MRGFVESDQPPRALVITGEPGIGKTTLWEAGVEAAKERGADVLVARGSEAEAQLSHAALADLLAPVGEDVLATLPTPQLHALEVALLRAELVGPPPQPSSIAAAVLSALRELSARGPVLVAVDDAPWLDRSSAEALAFAARRVRDQPIRFLLTRRAGAPAALEAAFEPDGARRLDMSALSFGAIRLMLLQRLGLTIPRRVLLRLFELAQGNPLFALELGRTVVEHGLPELRTEPSLPERIDELFRGRIQELSAPVRRSLVAVGLAGGLRTSELVAIVDPGAVEDAVDAGVLALDGERFRAAHPLLAESAKRHSSARERRELHLALARIVEDGTLRAQHLAHATVAPDADLAATIADAADQASARGATHDAVELAEQALRLTPRTSAEWSDRLVVLGERLMVTGEHARAKELVASAFDALPEGTVRARAHLLLADQFEHIDESEEHLQQALEQSADDPALHAVAAARWSRYLVACRVERIEEARRLASEALPAARTAGPAAECEVLHALALASMLRGRPLEDVRATYEAEAGDTLHIFRSVDRIAANQLALRGHLQEARAELRRLLELAEERGDAWSWAFVINQLSEVELLAGDWEATSQLLDEWDARPERPPVTQAYECSRALLAARRGLVDEALDWAAAATTSAEARGLRWDLLDALVARGIADLLAREPARAVDSLRAVWEHAEREGVDEPAAFSVAPDLVEALAELGQVDDARRVAERLRRLAREQEHPWGLATARRCDGLIAVASGTNTDDGTAQLRAAERAYGELGFRFDRARTLLALGRWERRLRRRAAARATLEQAAAAFDEIGSTGWAERAREELARISGRRRRDENELTPTERRAAELAASGLSNKEIAAALFVTVHTVELHLSRAYAKLGVRSRAQLAGRLGAVADDSVPVP